MKLYFLISLSALAALASHTQALTKSGCVRQIARAQELVLEAKERFDVGEVTRTQINQATLNWLSARFECRDISFADYCKESLPIARQTLSGIKQQLSVGVGSTQDVANAETVVDSLKELCR